MNWLNFNAQHLDQLIELVNNYEFDEEETYHEYALLRSIGEVNTPKAQQFLIEHYKSDDSNSDTQLLMLEALIEEPSQEKYKTVLSLMEYDLPLPSDDYSLNRLFRQLPQLAWWKY